MEHILVIMGVVWLAVISPGADFAMISRLSAVQGRRSGIMAAAGIATGCWLHVVYAIFGLALVERLFPQALVVMRIAGAAYLVYLGISMVLARPAANADGAPVARGSDGRAFVTGLLTNGLNPKTSMFVVSLYAQAIGPATPIGAQIGYGAFISLSHLLWFGAVAVFLSRPKIRAGVLANQRVANYAIGAILILLGVALALSDLGQGPAA
jgi:threonine/homoserine/homoserine lactone efflux protein